MIRGIHQRWASLGCLGTAAVLGYVLAQVAGLVWDFLRWGFPQGWPLTPPEIVGLCSAAILFFVFRRNERINTFVNESIAELAKVTWPPQKETAMSTGLITVVVGVCVLFISLYDVVWGWVVEHLY